MARGPFPLVVLVSLALAGCPGGFPTRVTPKPTGKPVAVAGVHPIALSEAQRVVDQKGTPAAIVGKAKLISDHGAGIISNNGAIISDHGAGLISNNGGGLTGKVKRGLLAAREENPLADAQIEVLDGAGRLLVDDQQKPLTARTDATGAYHFSAVLPAESLLFRIRLYNGGQLFAIVAHDERGKAGELAIDTASSLGASYVLARYVKNRQAIFDRLPAAEAQALHRDAEAAREQLDGTPSYLPTDLTAATDALRAKAKALDATLVRIESILLAGQQDLGNGKAATEVALASPYMAADAAGNLYVAEIGAFRIRRIDPAGRIDVFVGLGARTDGSNQGQTLEAVGQIAIGPDGALYATQILTGQVRRIKPDGSVENFYGAQGGPALDHPTPLAFGPDGTLYVGEVKGPDAKHGRLFAISKDGKATELPIPAISEDGGIFNGLAVRPDGTLLLADSNHDAIFQQVPGKNWEKFVALPGLTKASRISLGPDGSIYAVLSDDHKVVRITPDGTVQPFAGTGEAGYAGDGGPALQGKLNQPVATLALADGTVYISDLDGVVRRVASNGTISTTAGTRNVIIGEATTIPLNGPGGLAVDPQGRLVFSEAGSHTIKRLVDGRLEVVAGSSAGFSGDGGPATAGTFDNPAGIAYVNGDLFVLDVGNNRIRKVDAQGMLSTVVHGSGRVAEKQPGPLYSAQEAPFDYPLGAAAGPDGTLYWTDTKGQQVLHLRADGQVEVVAGTFEKAGNEGDGGPAVKALLDSPTGLAFDPAGDLYFCDSHNLCVRKIALTQPDHPITLAVGRTRADFFNALNAALGAGVIKKGDENGKDAHDVSLFGPAGICFDAAGSMYVSELGSAKLATFGGASGVPPEVLAALPQVGTRIRRITAGKIYTVAGDGTQVLNDPATDESMLYPFLMLFDPQGRLILADTALNQIKLLKPDALK